MRWMAPALVATFSLFSLDAGDCGGGGDPTPTTSRLLVGASVVTLLPEVDGSTSYFDPIRALPPLALEPGNDGRDPGMFIEMWDVGTLSIGNGARSSHWVHDEIRAGAVSFEDLERPDGHIVVLVTADVYMMFRQDIQEALDKVRNRVGPELYSRLDIVVTSTHNHMGPDTSGLSGLNHEYYDYLTDQLATVVVQALDNRQPALLKVAQSRYQFGLADSHAPYITDPTLNSMQVLSADDPSKVVATVVQWQNHPEDTLGFGDDIYATEEQAAYLKSIDECLSDDDGLHCNIEDQFISAGFPGQAVRTLMEETGAPAMYFSGPVGGLLAPLHAYVWETEGPGGLPAGDGTSIPEGAILIEKNFHKQEVNGQELAKRVMDDLSFGEVFSEVPVTSRKVEYYAHLQNLAFRVGLSLKANREPYLIGHLKRDLFICQEGVTPTDQTCVSDNYESTSDPYLHVPVRNGNYGKTELWYITLGEVSILTGPAEVVSELVEGLPADFVEDPRGVYYRPGADEIEHVAAKDYNIEGYVRQMMGGTYRWQFSLAMDEMGYMIPLHDFRIRCSADDEPLGGTPGRCKDLFQKGIMEFESHDSDNWAISGSRCREIWENPAVLEGAPFTQDPDGARLAWETCYYGQLFGDADGHYEETLSASWDIEREYITAAKEILGFTGELQDVNPNFYGYNLRD